MVVTVVPATSSDPVCQEMLGAYVADIAARMAAGFDPSRSSPPGPTDFDPPQGVFLLAYLDDVPVGCGALRTLEPGIGEIRRMYVLPDARGNGVGRRILEALEDEALGRGQHTVRLDTSEELAEAQALYEASGFTRVPAYNDNGYAARWYEKRIGPTEG